MNEVLWIEIKSKLFNIELIKKIDSDVNSTAIIFALVKILSLASALDKDGNISIKKNIPLPVMMLAQLFGYPLEKVRQSLKILIDFDMIGVEKKSLKLEDGNSNSSRIPSIYECYRFATDNNCSHDLAEKFYLFNHERNWQIDGAPINNWKLLFKSWIEAEKNKSGEIEEEIPKQPDLG